MTAQDIEEIRVRALRIISRMGVSRREASLLYQRRSCKSARSAEQYLSGVPLYQTANMARATLDVFPEIGEERLVLHHAPE